MHRSLVAIALAASATLLAAPASAAPGPQCGTTITASTRLTSNLTCAGTALTISLTAANKHISVDLNGHTITGNGLGVGIAMTDSSEDPTSSIDVVGGTISGFVSGLITANGLSLYPHNLNVRRMKITNTMQWSPIAVSGQYNIADSTFTNAGKGGPIGQITLTNSRLVNSRIIGGPGSTTRLYTNTFSGGGWYANSGATLTAVGNTITDCTYGIDLAGTVSAVVSGNTFQRCKVGIRLGQSFGPVTVEGNQILNSTEDGMQVDTELSSDPVSIAGNTFSKNGRHGLAGTAGPSTTIVSDTAEKNTAAGITVIGATDGGGNIARKNGAAPQCTGVLCAS